MTWSTLIKRNRVINHEKIRRITPSQGSPNTHRKLPPEKWWVVNLSDLCSLHLNWLPLHYRDCSVRYLVNLCPKNSNPYLILGYFILMVITKTHFVTKGVRFSRWNRFLYIYCSLDQLFLTYILSIIGIHGKLRALMLHF